MTLVRDGKADFFFKEEAATMGLDIRGDSTPTKTSRDLYARSRLDGKLLRGNI